MALKPSVLKLLYPNVRSSFPNFFDTLPTASLVPKLPYLMEPSAVSLDRDGFVMILIAPPTAASP